MACLVNFPIAPEHPHPRHVEPSPWKDDARRIPGIWAFWLSGVWLYHSMPVLTQRQALILFVVSALAAFAFFWTGTSQAIRTALNGENGGNSSAGTAHDRYAATDGVGSHDQFACGIHAQFDMALVGIFGTILQGAVIRLDAD